MIMQVIRVVPITLCQKASFVSEPDHQAMPKEPSTPQAAHSVAVAQPSSSDRKTSAISSMQGMRLADSFSFASSGIFGSGGGALLGCSRCQIAM